MKGREERPLLREIPYADYRLWHDLLSFDQTINQLMVELTMLALLMTSQNHTILVVADNNERALEMMGNSLRDIYQEDLRDYHCDFQKQILRVAWSNSSDFPDEVDLYQVHHLSSGDLLWLAHTGDTQIHKQKVEGGGKKNRAKIR